VRDGPVQVACSPCGSRQTALGLRSEDLVQAQVPGGKAREADLGNVTIQHRPSLCLGGVDVYPQSLCRLQQADGYVDAAAPPQGRSPGLPPLQRPRLA
jgi:hypothetical protein